MKRIPFRSCLLAHRLSDRDADSARSWRLRVSGGLRWALLGVLFFGWAVPVGAAPAVLDFVMAVSATSVGEIAGVRSVTVSPDGAHVYVAGSDDVVVFGRDGATGALTFVEAEVDGVGGVDGLDGALSVTVSPDGAHVYVASLVDDAVAVFSRDGSTGELTFVEAEFDGVGGADGLGGARSVTVSPNGAHVYVASAEDAVAAFSRDGSTGELTFVEAEFDGIGGVDGLARARSVTVSPDGAHAYVAGIESKVAVFSRDGSTGELTFVEAVYNELGFRNPSGSTSSVAVSSDGAHVYVASLVDDAVAVFSRDGSTGELTFVEAVFHGVRGVDGLNGPQSVTVSPDGAHVYLASNALAMFNRDAQTGALTFVEAELGVAGIFGGVVAGADSVMVSPDSAHVYVVQHLGDWGTYDTVKVFGGYAGCSPTPLGACRGAVRGRLSLVDSSNDKKDALTWRWVKGETTSAEEFEPGTGNHYVLCVYDESELTPHLVLHALAPAGGNCRWRPPASTGYPLGLPVPCWTVVSRGELTKFRYADRWKTPEGLRRIVVRASSPQHTSFIRMRGRGEDLGMPQLPLSLPLRVQLQSANGVCWEGTYSSARTNTSARFWARSD